MTKLVADVLAAATRAQRECEPTYGMLYLAIEAGHLGEREAALQIAEAASATNDGPWFALLAVVHAVSGRNDIEQLATKALQEASDWERGTLAEAYERAGDPARADEQIARIDEEQRFPVIAAVARIALAAGNLERAATLVDQPWASKADPIGLAAMKSELSRAYADRDDVTTARRLLEDAEKLDREGSTIARAKAWAALGDHERARSVAARIDKGRYREIESLATAEAYAAAGDTAKADTILAAYARQAADSRTAAGHAEAALTYLRFGRELGVRKNLAAAEAALATATDPVLAHSGHDALAAAYVLDRQFAKAADHIGALRDPERRATRLLELAHALKASNTQATPELEAAIGRLP